MNIETVEKVQAAIDLTFHVAAEMKALSEIAISAGQNEVEVPVDTARDWARRLRQVAELKNDPDVASFIKDNGIIL